MYAQGPKGLSRKQGAGQEVEHLGHEPVPCGMPAYGGGLASWTAVRQEEQWLGPAFFLSQRFPVQKFQHIHSFKLSAAHLSEASIKK